MNGPHSAVPQHDIAHAKASADGNTKQTLVNLSDNDWRIGQTLFLQHDSTRYLVKLIGFAEGKSVLVSSPAVDGKVQLVREGQSFVVRTFAGKRAYAFTSSVQKAVHVPFPYLHLAYPKQVSCTVVRRGARVEVELVAALTMVGAQHTVALMVKDISLGGAAGSARIPAGVPGEAFRLKCKVKVAGEDIYLDLPVVLRSVHPEDGKEQFRHGFEFGVLDVRDKLALGAFLHETQSDLD
ncbi:flagellar brake protein [Oxalobacteraceae bacterium OM1]|nr:flagellar brake protein [Oxalobacteraceae bacterium OM1]